MQSTQKNGASDDASVSLLGQIQAAELEIARSVKKASEASDRLIADARKQAAELAQEAQATGHREGQMQYSEAVDRAKAAGAEVLAQAQRRAEEIRRTGETDMDSLVALVVNFVTGTGAEGK